MGSGVTSSSIGLHAPAAATSVLAIHIVGPWGFRDLRLDYPTLATNPHAWHAMGYVAVLAVFGTGISPIL